MAQCEGGTDDTLYERFVSNTTVATTTTAAAAAAAAAAANTNLVHYILVISLSIDLSNEKVKSTSIPTTLSYLLHPGNVIFGPWIPYQYYIDSESNSLPFSVIYCNTMPYQN